MFPLKFWLARKGVLFDKTTIAVLSALLVIGLVLVIVNGVLPDVNAQGSQTAAKVSDIFLGFA